MCGVNHKPVEISMEDLLKSAPSCKQAEMVVSVLGVACNHMSFLNHLYNQTSKFVIEARYLSCVNRAIERNEKL